MNLRYPTFLLIIFFASVSLSCHTDQTLVTPTPPVEQPKILDLRGIVPLQIGNSWKYRYIGRIGWWAPDTTTDSTTIVDTVWMNNRLCYKYFGRPPHLQGVPSPYYESIDSADYMLDSDPSMPHPCHLLKAPISNGQHWRCADWDSLNYIGTFTVVSTDTTITVPAGTFYHVIHLVKSGIFEMDIAPGIGVIRKHEAELDSGYLMELIELHLQ